MREARVPRQGAFLSVPPPSSPWGAGAGRRARVLRSSGAARSSASASVRLPGSFSGRLARPQGARPRCCASVGPPWTGAGSPRRWEPYGGFAGKAKTKT